VNQHSCMASLLLRPWLLTIQRRFQNLPSLATQRASGQENHRSKSHRAPERCGGEEATATLSPARPQCLSQPAAKTPNPRHVHSLPDELDGVFILHPTLNEGQCHENRSPVDKQLG
jgi:hypothetical protein